MNENAPAAPAPRVIRIRLWPELAAIFLLLSELIWVSAFYNALSLENVPWPKVLLVLGIVVLVSHYLARWLNNADIADRPRRIIFVAWVLLALFGSLRMLPLAGQRIGLIELVLHPFVGITKNETTSFAQFWHLILVAILIWRGISKARDPVSVITAVRSFQIGLLIFAMYAFILAPFLGEGRSVLYLGLYLFLGLLAMTAARIAVVSELRGGRAGRVSRHWLLGIAGAALAVIAVTISISLLLRFPLTFLMGDILYYAFIALSFLTLLLTFPLTWIINILAPFLNRVFDNFPILDFFNDIQNALNQFAIDQSNALEKMTGTVTIGREITRVLVIAIVLLVILFALRWKPPARRESGEEDVSSLRGRFRLPSLPELNPRRILYRMTHAGRLLAAARIRQIYTELTDLCAELEKPRPQAATPQEFLPVMARLFPMQQTELELLTAAYEKIRYGELPENPREVQEAERAWAQIRAEGNHLRAEQRRARKAAGLPGPKPGR